MYNCYEINSNLKAHYNLKPINRFKHSVYSLYSLFLVPQSSNGLLFLIGRSPKPHPTRPH